MREKILLVDGNNLTLRALYGCAALYDSQGFPTGCLMTSVRMVSKAADVVRPLRTMFVWDKGHAGFRKKIYPEYKKRPPLDPDDPKAVIIDEWKQQVEALQNYLPLLGVGQIQIPGCEADDIIYRLRQILNTEEFDVVIATTDADFFQIVNENCTTYHLAKEKIYDELEVFKEYNVRPDRWVDYRSMTGDDSDNIDGIKGIGPKKAVEILDKFKTVERFFAFIEQDTTDWLNREGKKHHRSLWEGRQTVERNKKLMDLSLLPESEIPGEIVGNLLVEALYLKPDRQAFWKKCKEHQLNTLLAESHLWGLLHKEGV